MVETSNDETGVGWGAHSSGASASKARVLKSTLHMVYAAKAFSCIIALERDFPESLRRARKEPKASKVAGLRSRFL